MNKFYLACDESGRLGYVDKKTNKCGEISVVAGIIMDDTSFHNFANEVDLIVAKYQSVTKSSKFHITDFEPEVAASVRNAIFNLIKDFEYPLVYGAQYYSAFARIYQEQKEAEDTVIRVQKERGRTVSYPMGHIKKLSQAECFYSSYTKAACFIADLTQEPFRFRVLTDEIDNKTLENYEKQIARLHAPNVKKPLLGKRFIHSTKNLETFSVSSSLKIDSPITDLLKNSSGTISKDQAVHSIVADVIANSVNYYLEQYAAKSNFHHLNIQEAIAEHPLALQFVSLGIESTFTDKLYYHTGT
ncbi:hypothetical protein HRJ35_09965 [Shewanella oneidensis MR-1]|uniref:DUF3800 domain-containing protein n=1 Tax=Shewanella oneidensis (strain ATCC 700550 / JCM 31522 / CIP 106686 / LMG 19005 / NCIMB 14063 / MR-1) TaxID=211586 RepID=Q8EGK6_SHEON|nr:hypothetical protein [Shewanella oneidensis]AAN54652.1 uncharacterized protein SO_1595 [Shewanella oneidensis MR-1]MDX5996596.1 hypothetical protein [Shewanella oneidensis]MEE2028367.1 hypothetical protein [Shewanella oneidensis]QKG96307.1 hypothetical protein HRJ35_09965 [Shewanella oneidensis MR-1]